MRLSLITARRHGKEKFSVLCGPGDPRDINAQFKELVQDEKEASKSFSEVQLWGSQQGIIKRKRFAAPIPASKKKTQSHDPAAEAAEKAAAEAAEKADDSSPE